MLKYLLFLGFRKLNFVCSPRDRLPFHRAFFVFSMAKDKKIVEEKSSVIEPSNTSAPIDTSKWPLLLKNYGQLNVRSGHYTPLPYGCSPLSRLVFTIFKVKLLDILFCISSNAFFLNSPFLKIPFFFKKILIFQSH